jgi:hypothetical protein
MTEPQQTPGRASPRPPHTPLFDPALDYRAHPERYRIARGEQGVLTVEPYKSELLPLWRFRTPADARRSAAALEARFAAYRDAGDFPGMDMARKFLQMGYTRARRYANHRSGRKWSAGRTAVLPPDPDPQKAESAAIFKAAWARVAADPIYRQMATAHRARFETGASPESSIRTASQAHGLDCF